MSSAHRRTRWSVLRDAIRGGGEVGVAGDSRLTEPDRETLLLGGHDAEEA